MNFNYKLKDTNYYWIFRRHCAWRFYKF